MAKESAKNRNVSSVATDSDERKSFFDKYGANIIVVGLVLYLILLAIGTFAEIFKIQSILDWWIWSPIGK
jgi:hypothetical protein